tara:strand:- start:26963 stop:27292 length:330 start_codon:yes stop_codon:yes gene_type:complete
MGTVYGDIRPLRNRVIVRHIEKGQQKTKGGIIIPDDDRQERGIRPRWAQVYKVGSEITEVKEGQWVCIEHGRWGRGVELDTGSEKFEIRLAEPESILLVSDERPEDIYA